MLQERVDRNAKSQILAVRAVSGYFIFPSIAE